MTAGHQWKAGDVMIVENGCVHQHFNDDPEEEAILLVFKAKPLFLFMHLLFQKIVEWPPKAAQGAEDTSRRPTSERRTKSCSFEDRIRRSPARDLYFRADDLTASEEFRKRYDTRTNVVSSPTTCRGNTPPTA